MAPCQAWPSTVCEVCRRQAHCHTLSQSSGTCLAGWVRCRCCHREMVDCKRAHACPTTTCNRAARIRAKTYSQTLRSPRHGVLRRQCGLPSARFDASGSVCAGLASKHALLSITPTAAPKRKTFSLQRACVALPALGRPGAIRARMHRSTSEDARAPGHRTRARMPSRTEHLDYPRGGVCPAGQ